MNIAINFVKHIYEEWSSQQKQKQELSEVNIAEFNELVESISHTNTNFRSIVEGIINIRRQYVKMVEMSKEEDILRDPNLNL